MEGLFSLPYMLAKEPGSSQREPPAHPQEGCRKVQLEGLQAARLGMGFSSRLRAPVKAKLQDSFKVTRKHVASHQFHRSVRPTHQCCWLETLLGDPDLYTGTTHHIFSTADCSFLLRSYPLASVKWREKAFLLSKALLDTQEEDKMHV